MIRSREIIKTSLVGAAGNVFLSVFKLIIGFAENSRDKEASRMREPVQKLAGENPAVRSVHGFCLDKVDKVISLEAETDFDSGDSIAVKEDDPPDP